MFDWLMSFTKGLPTARKPKIIEPGIHYIINDPTTVDLFIEATLPKSSPLNISINGFVGGGQKEGTLEFQAANCYFTIVNSLNYIISKSRKPITNWAATSNLSINPRAGKDFNAYYDRRGLKFFYDIDPKTKKTVFTADSADVVSHELGHAILDILRPDFWNTQSIEVWAFHESFGDINAILSIMQYDQVLDRALRENSNNLSKSNIISRLAEELGKAIFDITNGQSGESPLYLRDAVNNFRYVEPEKLPSNSREDQLSSECHNFSRVWTGTWYDIMVGIYNKISETSSDKKDSLKKARDIACLYMLQAINAVPKTARLFDALARQMLFFDATQGNQYRSILLNVFYKRNVLRQQMMTMLSSDIVGETVEHDYGKTIIVKGLKTFKPEVSIMSNNKFAGTEIELASESAYHYDKEGNLVEMTISSEEDAINCAYACLEQESIPFKIEDGKLVREHFVCKCHPNNACDPNAPEYGKGYKGANNNNSCCKRGPINCDCNPPPIPVPPKLGCYVTSKNGSSNSYKVVGSTVSRRVC